MEPLSQKLERSYDQLLASPCLDHDPYSRSSLHTYRARHLAMAGAIQTYLPGPRNSIVDIGCHNAFVLRLCAELGFKQFIGVDFFPLPPERSFLTGLPGATFIKANFNEDGFLSELRDGTIDCVVSTEVFEHLYHHPLGYLRECWRILRPGGLLVLSTPNPCTLANAWRLARGWSFIWGSIAFAQIPKITRETQPLAVWDIHFREYTQSELQTIVAGLPGVQTLAKGFLATAGSPGEPLLKRAAKFLQWKLGLGHWRPLCTTQFLIIRRDA